MLIALGSTLLGCSYQHPLYPGQSSLPFFDAAHVQDSKGTGLVHTAPAHGPDDFLICLAKNLPVVSMFEYKFNYIENYTVRMYL